jgi:transcription initiation factor TFIIE subunit alpha
VCDNPMLVFIENMYDKETRLVLEYLMKTTKDKLTDEEIANDLGMKINTVRRALYNLLEQGLVSYRRVRDKSSGWFVYYWSLNTDKLNVALLQRKEKVLSKLKARLRYEEENEFYVCPVDGSRYTFAEALEYDFKCPRCGEHLVHQDNTDIKEVLRERIARIEEELKRERKLLAG